MLCWAASYGVVVRMVFDKNQTLVGFQEPLIHMYNKVRYSYHHRLCLRKASCGFQWWSQCQMLVAVLCSRVDVPCTVPLHRTRTTRTSRARRLLPRLSVDPTCYCWEIV